jgi:hypothetical protein
MTRTRIAVLAAAVLAAGLVPLAGAGAGAGTIPEGGPGITIVHGIGPGPATVDIYLGGTDATEWDLALAAVKYGDVKTEQLPAGGYNVLICTAAADPDETITACADNGASAVNGNSGTNVDVEAGVSELWVAAYGDPESGRPVVVSFPLDLSCVEPTADARATAVHAATAPPVDVLAAPAGNEPAPVVEDLAWGESASADVPAGEYDVAVELTDGTPVLEATVPLDAQFNTAAIVVGNPQFEAPFQPLLVRFPLEECGVATTVTTVPPTTPTTGPAAAVTTRPTFTG